MVSFSNNFNILGKMKSTFSLLTIFVLLYDTNTATILCGENSAFVPWTGKCEELALLPWLRETGADGPCPPGHWLIVDGNTVRCELYKCEDYKYYLNGYCYFSHNLKCQQGLILGVNSEGQTVCKCGDLQYYHKPTNACYKPYTQGPCPKKFLFLPEGNALFTCQFNECDDGFVFAPKFGCVQLDVKDSCLSTSDVLGQYSVVQGTSQLEIDCVGKLVEDPLSAIIRVPCKSGFFKSVDGSCKEGVSILCPEEQSLIFGECRDWEFK